MNEIEKNVCDHIEGIKTEIITFLQELIRIESCNPPGDTRKVVNAIKEKLKNGGVPCKLFSVGDIFESVVANLNDSSIHKPNLLFNSHIDTVPSGDANKWSYGPFSGEIVDGKLYGRGSADAKAPSAGMIMAFKALNDLGVNLRGSLTLNLVADEELGGIRGTKHLIDIGELNPDMVVIGENTENKVAVAEKGIMQLKIICKGRSAHASTPWIGINAISKMVKVLHLLETELNIRFARRSHPLTPPPSFNIGVIEGGVKANVVADQCAAIIDRRVLPSESLEEAFNEIKDIIEKAKVEDPELQVDIENYVYGPPFETSPFETSSEEIIVKHALSICSDFGIKAEPVGFQLASDGKHFAAKKIPTILLGPGDASRAHAIDEFVKIDDVIQATKIYALLAIRCLGVENL